MYQSHILLFYIIYSQKTREIYFAILLIRNCWWFQSDHFIFRHTTSILFWFWTLVGNPAVFYTLMLRSRKDSRAGFCASEEGATPSWLYAITSSQKIRFDGDEETKESNRKNHDENKWRTVQLYPAKWPVPATFWRPVSSGLPFIFSFTSLAPLFWSPTLIISSGPGSTFSLSPRSCSWLCSELSKRNPWCWESPALSPSYLAASGLEFKFSKPAEHTHLKSKSLLQWSMIFREIFNESISFSIGAYAFTLAFVVGKVIVDILAANKISDELNGGGQNGEVLARPGENSSQRVVYMVDMVNEAGKPSASIPTHPWIIPPPGQDAAQNTRTFVTVQNLPPIVS